jgi:hypothetical protein
MRAPFGLPFPGLAPGEDHPLAAVAIRQCLGARPPACIGLVAARRPADALPTVGWGVFDELHEPFPVLNSVWIAAVLRSWEDHRRDHPQHHEHSYSGPFGGTEPATARD